ILLEDGHALVADFGISRAITAAGSERLTETGIALGTPAYMSPEQGAEDGQADGRSDLYALGCVAYEMLAGAPPFTGPTGPPVLAPPAGIAEAYELYERANVVLKQRQNRANDSVAITLFERAVALDPSFAAAQAGLAGAYALWVGEFAPEDTAALQRAQVAA